MKICNFLLFCLIRARENTMLNEPVPEILCSKLDSIVLNMKLLHIKNVQEFLSTLIDKPLDQAVENSIKLLKR